MKIVTWNINGLRAILGQNPSRRFDDISSENKLYPYIYSEKADIVCLQETKCSDDQITLDLRTPLGYEAYFHSCSRKKGYSGVVTYTKNKPQSIKTGFGINQFDEEGRVVETDFGDFILFNVYFPNGTSGDERVQYKLEFYDALFNYTDSLHKKGREIIICGDYNTAHKEIDLARPKENEKNSGFLPIERKKIDEIVAMGYIDVFREFNIEPAQYSWWSHRGGARMKNIGWRIDYFFTTKKILPKVSSIYLQMDVMGSDHCPLVMEMNI